MKIMVEYKTKCIGDKFDIELRIQSLDYILS